MICYDTSLITEKENSRAVPIWLYNYFKVASKINKYLYIMLEISFDGWIKEERII
jgi:hypothetical protein